MFLDGADLRNPQQIVNAFGKHFATTFNSDNIDHICDLDCNSEFSNNTGSDINLCAHCYKCYCLIKLLSMLSRDDHDILNAVKRVNANNVCDADDLPAFVLVDCINCLLSALQHTFSVILKSQKVGKSLKSFLSIISISQVLSVFYQRFYIHMSYLTLYQNSMAL